MGFNRDCDPQRRLRWKSLSSMAAGEEMAGVVPKADGRPAARVFLAEGTECRSRQEESRRMLGPQSDPPGGEHAEEMTVRKQ